MFLFKVVSATVMLAGATLSANIPSSSVLHEKRALVSSEWIKRSEAPGRDINLPMRIFISSNENIDLGHDQLMAISDPNSSRFGKHWTAAEIHKTFSPSREAVNAVQEWLASSGISTHRQQLAPSRTHVQFNASVDEIESLLSTQYNVWEHIETGSLTVSCDEYYLPKHIKHHVDFIMPTTGLSRQDRRKQKRRASSESPSRIAARQSLPNATDLGNCSEAVTPECIRALYEIPRPTTSVVGNELGIFEAHDMYDQADLDNFFANYAPQIPNGTHPILQSIDGGTAPVPLDAGGVESALDLDIAYPLIHPQKIKLFQTLNSPEQVTIQQEFGIFDPFLDALDAGYCTYDGGDNPKYDPAFNSSECGEYKPTNVISISYGLSEAYFSPAFVRRQCHEFMKLGLMGTSLIVASGDNGTLSRAPVAGCLANGSQNPGFPASCPYVTSVGATQIQPGASVAAPEVAVNPENNNSPSSDLFGGFSSGGGFSNYFTRPAYQDSAVKWFLNHNTNATQLPPRSTYNSTGRGFPDVSANGCNIVLSQPTYNFTGQQYYEEAAIGLDDGTSASAPIFASIINRLNEERILIGKKPVGFLNPILYKYPEMFNDIVEGYNLGCNGTSAFYATEGWDPVTGLGTPNYPRMKDVFLSLP